MERLLLGPEPLELAAALRRRRREPFLLRAQRHHLAVETVLRGPRLAGLAGEIALACPRRVPFPGKRHRLGAEACNQPRQESRG